MAGGGAHQGSRETQTRLQWHLCTQVYLHKCTYTSELTQVYLHMHLPQPLICSIEAFHRARSSLSRPSCSMRRSICFDGTCKAFREICGAELQPSTAEDYDPGESDDSNEFSNGCLRENICAVMPTRTGNKFCGNCKGRKVHRTMRQNQ
jgi:hypothetical protein